MPNGSLIPHLFINSKPMPLCIYIAWFIFGLRIEFHGGRTFIDLETNRNTYMATEIVLWHGRTDFWSPERGNFSESVWKIEIQSQHWIDLAYRLQEFGFPWAKITVLQTDVIQCQDAEIEGSIFGIKSRSLFDS